MLIEIVLAVMGACLVYLKLLNGQNRLFYSSKRNADNYSLQKEAEAGKNITPLF